MSTEQDAHEKNFSEVCDLEAKVATLEAERDELQKRLGKPRCITCNHVGMTNCSHFDNCAGVWKYELEEKSETLEARVRELEAALRHTLEGQHVVGSDGCADCREARALLSKEPTK